MKAQIELSGKVFRLESRLVAQGVPFPNNDIDGKDNSAHNHFKVTIIRQEESVVKKQFDFYDSQANYQKGLTDFENENDLIFAFRSFIEDCNYGTMEFSDFCAEFGYDQDSRRAERIHKLCQKSLNKLMDLGVFQSEINDMINELSEKGIE